MLRQINYDYRLVLVAPLREAVVTPGQGQEKNM